MSTANASPSKRFNPSLSAGLRELVEAQIPAKGKTTSAVIRRALAEHLASPTDLSALRLAQKGLVAMRFPHDLYAQVDARAAADTRALRLASGGRLVRPVTHTDVLVAAISALDPR